MFVTRKVTAETLSTIGIIRTESTSIRPKDVGGLPVHNALDRRSTGTPTEWWSRIGPCR